MSTGDAEIHPREVTVNLPILPRFARIYNEWFNMSTHTVTKTNIGIITGLPSKYKVILLNDNFTPVDFVIALLIDVFGKNEDDAINITWQVHHNGKGIAGVYYHELAEQKVQEATRYSRKSGFPLILYAEED